jgi:predicted permease
MLDDLFLRFRSLFRRRAVEAEIDDELRFHLERQTEKYIQFGMSRAEASRHARLEFGGFDQVKQDCREARGITFLDSLLQDVRYAFRGFLHNPGFTAIAVASLALGIGANTAIFTVAQHMLLDRLSVSHPETLRMFYWSEPKDGIVEEMWGWWDDLPGGGQVSTSFSYPAYEQMRRDNRSLADIFAFKPYGRMTLLVHGQAQAAETEMVSGNYYSTLGIQPLLGRGIQESDDASPGSGPVVTISDRLWTNVFGRSPSVLGKTIQLNSIPMTIVGVNPPGFTGAFSAQGAPDIFLPFSMQPLVAPQNLDPQLSPSLLTNKTFWWVLVMGRTKPGVPDATAEAALNVALSSSVRATMPLKKDSQIPRLLLRDGSRGQNPSVDSLEKPVYVLMALAGFVLLLACANLANLLLARAGARHREISVRLALGAGRARILRQMMTESLLLSSMGGAAGLLLAWTVRNAIPRLLANSWAPPAFAAKFSWPIFAFAAAVSILTGFIFGLAPAWQATRVQVSSSLKDSGQTVTQRRRGLGGKTIVAIQIALSMLLVVGAGLFVRTLLQLGRSPLGFHSHNLLLFGVELPETRYPRASSTPILHRLEDRLSAIPGVQSVTLSDVPLISGNAMMNTFIPQGQRPDKPGKSSALANDVGAGFFSTYGIPIDAGRAFDQRDTSTSRKVAIINESLARKFYPHLNPIGRSFQTGFNPPFTVEIIGVCADAKYYRVRKDVEPTFYAPYSQVDSGLHNATFAISTRLEGQAILPSLREAIRQVDPNLPMLDVRTQDEQIASNLRQERIFAILTAAFGILALALACTGIYGVMAYSVAQRTNEIGIRMALGARPAQVHGMILRESTFVAAAGVLSGLGAALALARLVTSMLYGIEAHDPLTLAGAALLLLGVALCASWIPAQRAASVQPIDALRHE